MTTKNPLRRIGEQIQAIMPAHSASSQNAPLAARVIDSYENVPEVYQEFFAPHRSKGRKFPYTIVTSTDEASGETITGKLLCAINHNFYVLEGGENSITKTCYPIDDIQSVQVVHRPSDMLIKVSGTTNLGLPATSTFGCDKESGQLFTPLFQRIRLRIVSLNEKAPSRRTEKLNRWNDLNTHVIDMARHCLLPGETVIEAILQPEIRASLFSSDRVFRGAKSPTHICILTDKELVMIREDISLGKKDKPGSVCNFVPLTKIHSIALNENGGNLLSISIHLANGEVFEPLFDASLKDEVEQFLTRTRERMPKEKLYRRD